MKGKQGFASWDKDKLRAIASQGGKSSNGKNLNFAARSKGGKSSKRGLNKTKGK